MKKRVKLHIEGVVQGVGFRPYVYKLSKRFGLGGHVFNDTKGVTVELEGEPSKIDGFISVLGKSGPAASAINTITKKEIPVKGEKVFSIGKSRQGDSKFVMLPADIGICDDCLRELFDKYDRRYLYPFINCTNCGPRFSIINGVPYDRAKTTMNEFKMCPKCSGEYKNSLERRFHAEPISCFNCGPTIKLLKEFKGKQNAYGKNSKKDLVKTAELIHKGKIIAIKGIGGYHLGCDARNIKTVRRLRALKKRFSKPFAIMAENIDSLEEICFLSDREKEVIVSRRRPIILLKIKKHLPFMEAVAPGQLYLGVVLAYAPIHYLIFRYLKKYSTEPILVMTSANKENFPLVSEEEELLQIKGYADYSLVHNRGIQTRSDDSIVRVFENKEIITRKSRGYIPDFMDFAHKKTILSCGGELKNTFAIVKNGYLINSPYIGDLKNYKNYEFFLNTLSHYKNILDVKPEVIAHDYHPEYLSTQYALSLNKETVAVWHHHAHLAACLFENNIKKKVIGVCFDGAGLGADNAIWGGEFFLTDQAGFKRLAHFRYFGLLGTDKSAEEPRRMAFSLLYDIFGKNMFKYKLGCAGAFTEKEKSIFYRLMREKEFILSSSVGRIFDAAASILGIMQRAGYEAEAAILLEMLASSFTGKAESYDYKVKKEKSTYVIDWQPLFTGFIKDVLAKKDKKLIAYKFHLTFATIISEVCILLRKENGVKDVALSGGVFQNFLLMNLVVPALKRHGFSVHYHKRIPTNDSGISVGQAVVAAAQMSAGSYR
ncbi:MAG: carbamoyltransferase HypF [Candidatus Omnitrophota bacterium]|jgi:hydrogenase maturation protein HypF